ncbi:MAG TPA: hypothetical protein VED01_21655 [Burkholderiales bacterium]|nr:hypothetical protein [Burkholderiales bacterium]
MSKTGRLIDRSRIALAEGDISAEQFSAFANASQIAWDIETTGLDWKGGRIATCQLFSTVVAAPVIVRIQSGVPKRLVELLESPGPQKLFHHACFDLRFMSYAWGCKAINIACTKVASKILLDVEKHSLDVLVGKYLGVTLAKQFATSDWTVAKLSDGQVMYAASDVIYLPALYDALRNALCGVGRWELALRSFEYIPTRVELDMQGSGDVFTY